MQRPNRIASFTAASLTAALAWAATARAQEEPPAPPQPTAEVAELEALLQRVDAALAKLEPVLATRLVQYDVRHLLWRPHDRTPPRLSTSSHAVRPAGWRNSAAGSFSFDDGSDDPPHLLDAAQLEQIVTARVGEDAWARGCSLELHRGYLFVRQTAAGHARIAALLARLKREESRAVQLEVQLYVLSPELQAELEHAAAQSDGVLVPAALARLDQAVAAERGRLAGCALITALDRQRVFLHQGAEQRYVASYESSSGGTGEVVAEVDDPLVDVLVTGLVLDVRPTILDGPRRRVALDVRFTRSHAASLATRQTPWGPIDVPQLLIDAVRTSARVPPGSGMLVFSTQSDPRTAALPDVSIVVRPRIIAP